MRQRSSQPENLQVQLPKKLARMYDFRERSSQSANLQGGRRYFSRREITALVYRHILVMPPTAKVVTAEKRKTAYRQNNTAVLHYRRKNTAIFWFYRFHKKNNANSRYSQKVPPTLDTAQNVPPTLDTAQKVPPTLDTAQKVPPTLDTAQKVCLLYTSPSPRD